MKLVIDIDEEIYKDIMIHNREMREGGKSAYYFEELIQNGKPLPKGHGDLIDRKSLMSVPDRKSLMVRPYEKGGYVDWYDEIKYAETIIEADKE